MARAFVVGDKFRTKVRQLLEKDDSALPPRLREELKETLAQAEPATLAFSTARKLRQYLQEEGKQQRQRGPAQNHNKVSLLTDGPRSSFLPARAGGGRLVAPAGGCEAPQSKCTHPTAKVALLRCVYLCTLDGLSAKVCIPHPPSGSGLFDICKYLQMHFGASPPAVEPRACGPSGEDQSQTRQRGVQKNHTERQHSGGVSCWLD